MAIEIEKKYRLTKSQQEKLLERLPEIGATRQGKEFEVNICYKSETLNLTRSVLRLRRIGERATLTYKERFPTPLAIKHQREDETGISDPDALELILGALGFTAALIYEKRRETWQLKGTEIVIDELPFGLFMEIEGKEKDINALETRLGISDLRSEMATYPELTLEHGTDRGSVIESRFTD